MKRTRQRQTFASLAAIVALTLPVATRAELNPLRLMEEKLVQPQVMIVLDTSGSMNWTPTTSYNIGGDCEPSNVLDVCGDGMCTGAENNGNCSSDCTSSSSTDPKKGTVPSCNSTYLNRAPGRMSMAKGALRNVLPSLRSTAAFGLVTFQQTGYYPYMQAASGDCTTTKHTVYFSQLELMAFWSITDDAAPPAQHSWNNTTYHLLSSTALSGGDSLYRSPEGNGYLVKRMNYCGHSCYSDGRNWGWLGSYYAYDRRPIGAVSGGSGSTGSSGSSISKCQNQCRTAENPCKQACNQLPSNRRNYCNSKCRNQRYACEYGCYPSDQANYKQKCDTKCFYEMWECHYLCQETWGGSGGQTTQCINQCGPTYAACKKSCSDGETSGNCTASNGNISTFPTYMGPQFTDGNGRTWVYYGFTYNGGYQSGSPVYGGNGGSTLEQISLSAAQSDQDAVLGRIMSRLNIAQNGGVIAAGGTPLGEALRTARYNYEDMKAGKNAFVGNADVSAACRPRSVLVVCDGYPNGSVSSTSEAKNLHDQGIKVYVVGFSGADMNTLNAIAKAGGTEQALYANNPAELETAIKDALLSAVRGDYVTSAASVTTMTGSSNTGDLALMPSVELPDWKGHLRGFDVAQVDPVEIWDAGALLAKRNYATRKIYSGFGEDGGQLTGAPVPLLVNGLPNTAAIKALFRFISPSNADVEGLIYWIAGKDRQWKLGAPIRAQPAIVGPPEEMNIADHRAFEKLHAARERLIYVTTNEGVLHAFRNDGSEAFAYVAPSIWHKLYALWKAGGQSPIPARHKWIMASSPRVADVRSCETKDGKQLCQWRTQLVLTMGPGDEEFAALDITSPSTCVGTTCTTNDPPLKVLYHSRLIIGSWGPRAGQTWSVPAVFYGTDAQNEVVSRTAMGSGYGSGTEGEYYNYFKTMTPYTFGQSGWSYDYKWLGGSGSIVDYAVIANTSAVVDSEANYQAIATYQADLVGNVFRYGAGIPTQQSTVLAAGTTHPFHHAPAVIQLPSKDVVVSAVSGSFYEANPWMAKVGSIFEPSIFVRREVGGAVSATKLDCPISKLCSGQCGDYDPALCKAPPKTARPLGSPLLLYNKNGGGSAQSLFQFYTPGASGSCGRGNSYLVWLKHGDGNNPDKVLLSREYPATMLSGMSVSGNGSNVVMTISGPDKATLQKVKAQADTGGATTGPMMVESWRPLNN